VRRYIVLMDASPWLATLPGHTRKLAKRLGFGESTQNATRMFGISCGRVSQMRRELEHSWRHFQGKLSSTQTYLFGELLGVARTELVVAGWSFRESE
jgi:hypothetical protein